MFAIRLLCFHISKSIMSLTSSLFPSLIILGDEGTSMVK